MNTPKLIGVLDIGGTKILVGLIDPAGELLARRRIETLAERGAEDIIARIVTILHELLYQIHAPQEALEGIGCSIPGPLYSYKGIVYFSPNLNWRDVPFVELMHRHLDIPIVIEDDAECSDEALRFIMASYVRENTLCLQVGSSRPEEGSEHFLGYNIECLSRHGYVHGQLICLCSYAMARAQDNRPEWVYSLIERANCPGRLQDLGITHDTFVQALLTLPEYALAEGFPASVISQRPISTAFAEQLACECERR